MRYGTMNMHQRTNSIVTGSWKMIDKREKLKIAGLSVLVAAGIGFSVNNREIGK